MMNEFTTALEKSDKTHWADTIQNENTRWSIEEDNVLRRFYPSEGSDVAYRLRGRTVASCQFRACKLGVNRIQPHKNGNGRRMKTRFFGRGIPKLGFGLLTCCHVGRSQPSKIGRRYLAYIKNILLHP